LRGLSIAYSGADIYILETLLLPLCLHRACPSLPEFKGVQDATHLAALQFYSIGLMEMDLVLNISLADVDLTYSMS